MPASFVAVIALSAYVICSQWAFRCQRVGRNLLLLRMNKGDNHLLTQLLPTSAVVVTWIGRVLWLVGAWAAWRAWHWYGIGAVLMVSFVSMVVDGLCPWPNHLRLLELYKARVRLLRDEAVVEAFLTTIVELEEALKQGGDFEKLTVGEVLARDARRAQIQKSE